MYLVLSILTLLWKEFFSKFNKTYWVKSGIAQLFFTGWSKTLVFIYISLGTFCSANFAHFIFKLFCNWTKFKTCKECCTREKNDCQGHKTAQQGHHPVNTESGCLQILMIDPVSRLSQRHWTHVKPFCCENMLWVTRSNISGLLCDGLSAITRLIKANNGIFTEFGKLIAHFKI